MDNFLSFPQGKRSGTDPFVYLAGIHSLLSTWFIYFSGPVYLVQALAPCPCWPCGRSSGALLACLAADPGLLALWPVLRCSAGLAADPGRPGPGRVDRVDRVGRVAGTGGGL